jgi:hypothetical protein
MITLGVWIDTTRLADAKNFGDKQRILRRGITQCVPVSQPAPLNNIVNGRAAVSLARLYVSMFHGSLKWLFKCVMATPNKCP